MTRSRHMPTRRRNASNDTHPRPWYRAQPGGDILPVTDVRAIEERLAEQRAQGIGTRGLALHHLQDLRIGQTLSQEELAEASGISVSTIWRAEHGQPMSLRNVRRVAQALGTSYIEDLL